MPIYLPVIPGVYGRARRKPKCEATTKPEWYRGVSNAHPCKLYGRFERGGKYYCSRHVPDRDGSV